PQRFCVGACLPRVFLTQKIFGGHARSYNGIAPPFMHKPHAKAARYTFALSRQDPENPAKSISPRERVSQLHAPSECRTEFACRKYHR
ncbi:hypothetical protein ACTXNP_27100, partial [Pseudomonas helleri]|uniref:hypothetical protein n=1 Tax=Pseudomonas helleri TaxID=1608996 RepID=UPI003FCF57A8